MSEPKCSSIGMQTYQVSTSVMVLLKLRVSMTDGKKFLKLSQNDRSEHFPADKMLSRTRSQTNASFA